MGAEQRYRLVEQTTVRPDLTKGLWPHLPQPIKNRLEPRFTKTSYCHTGHVSDLFPVSREKIEADAVALNNDGLRTPAKPGTTVLFRVVPQVEYAKLFKL